MKIDKKITSAVIVSVVLGTLLGNLIVPDLRNGYNPDDPIYRYIVPADETWTDKFGDTERVRLIHAISELRVVVNNQGRLLQQMLDPNGVKDPNDPTGMKETVKESVKSVVIQMLKNGYALDSNEAAKGVIKFIKDPNVAEGTVNIPE